MPVTVECPGCFETRKVPEAKLGSKLKCPTCGKVFVAQGSEAPAARSTDRPSKRKKSKSSNSGLLIGGGVGAAVVALLVGGYLWLGSGGNAEVVQGPGGGGEAPTSVAGEASSPSNATASTGWMEPDPLTESLEWTRDLNTDLRIELDSEELRVVTPALLSPFVATAGNSSATVYDLRSGKSVHHIEFPVTIANISTLSPDGNRFAQDGFLLPKTAPGVPVQQPKPSRTFHYWSMESGKQLGETSPVADGKSIQWGQFHSSRDFTVFSISASPQAFDFVVSSVAAEHSPYSFNFQDYMTWDVFSMSPGGRYLVFQRMLLDREEAAAKTNLKFAAIDVQAGKVCEIPNRLVVNFSTSTAFSHDGKRLAILQNVDQHLSVIFLDTASGSKEGEIKLSGDVASLMKAKVVRMLRSGSDISWLPDGSHLVLFGKYVIDSKTGNVVLNIEYPDGETPHEAKVLGHAVVYVSRGKFIRCQKIEIPDSASPSGK